MRKRLVLQLLFLLAAASCSYGQSVAKCLRNARNAVDAGDFGTGAAEYKKALAKDSSNFDANLEYGLLLFEYMNEPGGAGRYLLKAEKNSKKDTFPELFFGLAKYYHHMGEFAKAKAYYGRFARHIDTKDKDGVLLDNEVKRLSNNCDYALSDSKTVNSKRLRVTNSGAELNTIYPEYVPVLSSDKSTLMFTSRRRIHDKSKIDDENGGFYEDMFVAQRDASGKYKNPVAFSLQPGKQPGSVHKHESAISLTYVGDKFFTFYDGQIYESVRQGNGWSSPAVLNHDLNAEGEFKNHICISHDGHVMIYSAEGGAGSMGGLDLYRSVKGADGKWSAGENLGPEINTQEDEGGPQLNEDGTILYFSSKGLPGYGGYDFYKTSLENGKWSRPVNLGEPFNSPGDDIYITLNDKGNEGFLSSERAGGFGDMDVYQVGLVRPFSDFKVDDLARVTIVMPDTVYVGDTAKLQMETKNGTFVNYYWQVNDSILSQEGLLAKYVFRNAGPATVRAEAELDKVGDLVGAQKKIFVAERPTVVATNTTTSTAAPSLETIYFDLNKSDLDETAQASLDRNLEVLKKNPDMVIEIGGYCDSRGSATYNQALSHRRATAALNYLKKKGFNVRQVSRTGWFGESFPINRCTDGVPCSEEEYRLNRRVEFKWVEKK